MATSDGEPKSVEAMISSVVQQAGAGEPPKFEGVSENIARVRGSRPSELESATMSQ